MLVEHQYGRGIPQKSAEQLAEIAFEFLQRRRVELKQSMIEMLDLGDAFFGSEAPNMATTAHQSALHKGLVPEERVDKLNSLRWRIDKLKDEKNFFLLPDTIAIQIRKDIVTPYVISSNEELGTVVMPLNKNTLLIGSAGKTINRKKINSQLASCSDSFFVAPLRTRHFEDLRPNISTAAMEEITKIIFQTSLKL